MKYNVIKDVSLAIIIRAGACNELIDLFDSEYYNRGACEIIMDRSCPGFIEWAENAGFLDWFIEKRFVGESIGPVAKIGDMFLIGTLWYVLSWVEYNWNEAGCYLVSVSNGLPMNNIVYVDRGRGIHSNGNVSLKEFEELVGSQQVDYVDRILCTRTTFEEGFKKA